MFNSHEKAAIVSLLMEMANADDVVTFEELVASNNMYARLNVSREEFDLGRNLNVKYAIQAMKAMTKEQQVQVAKLLVEMIDSDSNVSTSELQLLNLIGKETGLDQKI